MEPITIFIIDDDPIIRETLEALLQAEAYKLVFFDGGSHFLENAHRYPLPDLILLDIMMPEIDGYKVCSILRADEKWNIVPIIMLTALNDDASRLTGFRTGTDYFISKPFSRQELLVRIRAALRPKLAYQK
jgi:putative two-component system response regulator